MGQSLSRDSHDILDAAAHGDIAWFRQQLAFEPKLVKSVTLLKRRGVLHLAAKQGHSQVLNAVLEPLIEAVRAEYYAQQASAAKEKGTQQHPMTSSSAHAEQCVQRSTCQEARQQHRTPQQQQQQQPAAPQQELQLASFTKLRQAVNARDLYRRTPLIIAAKQGHLECTEILVESASNLFAVDREGNTSLHYAALHGHAAVVQYLVQKASDRNLAHRFVNKCNLSGFTPLHYAVWGCNEQLVQHILQAGSDVTAVNDRVFDAWVTVPVGSTPLHLAVVRNHLPIALLLLQHYVVQVIAGGTDTPHRQDPRTMVNLFGMNPAQLAAHRGLRQLSRILSPALPLSRVLEAFEPSGRRSFGPSSLKALAAGVMQTVLNQQLDQLEQQTKAEQAGAIFEQAKGGTVVHAAPSNSRTTRDAAYDLGCCARGHTAASDCPCCRTVSACEVEGLSRACNVMCCAVVEESIRRTDSEEIYPADEPTSVSASFACASQGLELLNTSKCLNLKQSCGESSASCLAGDSNCGDVDMGSFQHSSNTLCNLNCSASVVRDNARGNARTRCQEEQCCVCWEEELSVSMTPCSHALCLGCARQLVVNSAQSGATCPLCRSFIATFGLLPPVDTGGARLVLVSGAGI